MTVDKAIELVVAITGTIMIPVFIYVIRVTARWARFEEKLVRVMNDVEKLVRDKDTTHAVMLETMHKDRKATDDRLRWLENHLWAIIGPKRDD